MRQHRVGPMKHLLLDAVIFSQLQRVNFIGRIASREEMLDLAIGGP